jgi:error-prone DNA polymerase
VPGSGLADAVRAGVVDEGAGVCPKCGADDRSMIERIARGSGGEAWWFCNVCAHEWAGRQGAGTQGHRGDGADPGQRFGSLDRFVAETGAHRDELAVLAEIGALQSFGDDRRSALWQIERAARPAGELFEQQDEVQAPSPLRTMTPIERVVADYAGTGLTIGPHPMALRRGDLSLRGVLRASDLPGARRGRRVRVAGAVITRQRPGTAKGFVFLTLEDETGISNVIVRPDLFDRYRTMIVGEPFLLIEGVLQHQDGVVSIRADRLQSLGGAQVTPASHDFH